MPPDLRWRSPGTPHCQPGHDTVEVLPQLLATGVFPDVTLGRWSLISSAGRTVAPASKTASSTDLCGRSVDEGRRESGKRLFGAPLRRARGAGTSSFARMPSQNTAGADDASSCSPSESLQTQYPGLVGQGLECGLSARSMMMLVNYTAAL
jgi:hypothetical protein